MVEFAPPVTLSSFACYPLSFVVKMIRAKQKAINHYQHAAAINALEFFYANTEADSRPKRDLEDYLPFATSDEVKKDGVFDVFTETEHKFVSILLERLVFGHRIHGLMYALGWTD